MVVVARFVVVLRQLNGLVAGTTGMPWPHFLAANVVGAALWVGALDDARLPVRPRHPTSCPFFWHHLSLVADGAGMPLLILALFVLRPPPPPRPSRTGSAHALAPASPTR